MPYCTCTHCSSSAPSTAPHPPPFMLLALGRVARPAQKNSGRNFAFAPPKATPAHAYLFADMLALLHVVSALTAGRTPHVAQVQPLPFQPVRRTDCKGFTPCTLCSATRPRLPHPAQGVAGAAAPAVLARSATRPRLPHPHREWPGRQRLRCSSRTPTRRAAK